MPIHFNSSNIYKGLLNKVLFLLNSTVFIKLFQSNFARTHKKNQKKKYKTENTPKNNVQRLKKFVPKRSSEPHHRRETLFFKK